MDMPVSRIKGIGPKRAQTLARLGIVTRGDLVHYAPVDYRDTRIQTPIARLHYGQTAVFTAKVVANRLGHVNTRTTLEVYSHVFAATEEKAMQAIDMALFRKAK